MKQVPFGEVCQFTFDAPSPMEQLLYYSFMVSIKFSSSNIPGYFSIRIV